MAILSSHIKIKRNSILFLIKLILFSEINDDFGKKEKIHEDKNIDNKKSTSDETTKPKEDSNTTNNDSVQAKRKDLEDLLSQLYSQPESTKENLNDQPKTGI